MSAAAGAAASSRPRWRRIDGRMAPRCCLDGRPRAAADLAAAARSCGRGTLWARAPARSPSPPPRPSSGGTRRSPAVRDSRHGWWATIRTRELRYIVRGTLNAAARSGSWISIRGPRGSASGPPGTISHRLQLYLVPGTGTVRVGITRIEIVILMTGKLG